MELTYFACTASPCWTQKTSAPKPKRDPLHSSGRFTSDRGQYDSLVTGKLGKLIDFNLLVFHLPTIHRLS